MTNLISGKDALIALANGEEVEYWCENDPSIQKRWTPIKALSDYKLSYFLENKPRFEFRLKPRTISINGIEVPAPFEPKVGEGYFYLNAKYKVGYSKTMREPLCNQDNKNIENGAWLSDQNAIAILSNVLLHLKN